MRTLMPSAFAAPAAWRGLGAGLLLALFSAGPVAAAPATPVTTPAIADCAGAVDHDTSTRRIALTADCTTSEPIRVPDGWTLDGGGFVIQPRDGADAPFTGAVIAATGRVTMTDVTIDGSGLTAPCTPGQELSAVTVTDGRGRISGLTVRHLRRPDPAFICTFGLDLAGRAPRAGTAAVQIADSRFVDTGGWAVRVREGAGASIRQSTFADGEVGGVLVAGAKTVATVDANRFDQPGHCGVCVDGAVAIVTGNSITDATGYSIQGTGGAQLSRIAQNQIAGTSFGIALRDASSRAIIDNVITRSLLAGIELNAGSVATIEGNKISPAQNLSIVVSGGSEAKLSRNALRGGEAGLLVIGPETTARIYDLTVMSTRGTGIEVAAGAEARFVTGVINGCTTGILAGELAQVVVNGVSIHECEVGIQAVKPGATVDISVTWIMQSGNAGMVVGGGTRAAIADNRIDDAGAVGIDVVAGDGAIIIERNLIVNTGAMGIGVEDATNVAIRENRIAGAIGGVFVKRSSVTVTRNRIESMVITGIGLVDAMDSHLEQNRIESEAQIGIAIEGGQDLTLDGNSIIATTDPGLGPTAGISLQRVNGARVSNNEVSGYTGFGACGILVAPGPGEVVLSGNDFPAPGNRRDQCLPGVD